jgi:hypothetical protein
VARHAAAQYLVSKPVPGPAPANQTRTSHTSQNAWATWNNAGGDVGKGAVGCNSGNPRWQHHVAARVPSAIIRESI